MRKKLLIFLKGSNASKRHLQSQDPQLFANFQSIWKVRNSHMVKGLPAYIFYLICCYERDCMHPRCQTGKPQSPFTWYPGGPTIYHLSLPFADPNQPLGNSNCEKCKGDCSGHYIMKLVDIRDKQAVSNVPKPPSSVMKKLFSDNGSNIPESRIVSVAKEVLLSCDKCKVWLNHLQTVLNNRR